jgi:hypothetical protein
LEFSMLNKLFLGRRNKEATQVRAFLMLVLFVSALFCGHAIGQTEQTSFLLPGNGAPLLVTPEVHLTSPAPAVGATNATAGNTAGATNQTVAAPFMAHDLGTVPQYAGPAYTVTITPLVDAQRVAPSTPEVHLGTVSSRIGATNATTGNAAGAGNATTTLPVMPRASSTVPEFTVRGNTVLIIPPPEAIPSAPESLAGEMSNGARQVVISEGVDRGVGQTVDLDGNTPEISLGEVAREYRQRTSASRAAVVTDEELRKSDIAAAR